MTPTQAIIEECRLAAGICRRGEPLRLYREALAFTLDLAADALERLSGPPVIEPMNPYRPETDAVIVPAPPPFDWRNHKPDPAHFVFPVPQPVREDEEAPADPRVVERVVKPGERTRMDRKGVGEQ
jgi:hypothetical protein